MRKFWLRSIKIAVMLNDLNTTYRVSQRYKTDFVGHSEAPVQHHLDANGSCYRTLCIFLGLLLITNQIHIPFFFNQPSRFVVLALTGFVYLILNNISIKFLLDALSLV